jgi:hypothetical protein
MGLCLLGVLLTLNLAAVLPSLHAVWHEGEHCEPGDCAVAAFSSGSVDPVSPVSLPVRSEVFALELPATPLLVAAIPGDCPLVPGRAPPV